MVLKKIFVNMAKKKTDSVTIRLPEELRRFEAYGFESISDFIKTALVELMNKKDSEIGRANEILASISKLIQEMEADRDYNYADGEYPKGKEELLASLYLAAKPIADAKVMVDHPANWIDYPEEMKEEGFEHGESHYIHTWAR
jgi:Arc/MetJ-type ribon-helix-helix transcriptional regulator